MTSPAKAALALAAACVSIAAASPARDASPPAEELLEFLGTFEITAGEAIDPLALAQLPAAKERPRPQQPAKATKTQTTNQKKDDRDDTR